MFHRPGSPRPRARFLSSEGVAGIGALLWAVALIFLLIGMAKGAF